MWILYQRIEKKENTYRYAYSRESRELDGIIMYDTDDDTTIIEKPCAKDMGSKFAIMNTIENFDLIIEEGFPEKRFAAFG